MKPGIPRRTARGLTLLEVLVVIVSLFILTATLLTAVNAPRIRSAVGCVNQLKQTGMAARVWEDGFHGKNPMPIPVVNGGAMEFAAQGNAEALFQLCSNELGSPKVLVCPADRARRPAHNFSTRLTSSNISYFINLDSHAVNPQDALVGDDNLEIRGARVKSGLLEISSNTPVIWSADRHRLYGNFALADGSVMGVNNAMLTNYFRLADGAVVRLAIP